MLSGKKTQQTFPEFFSEKFILPDKKLQIKYNHSGTPR